MMPESQGHLDGSQRIADLEQRLRARTFELEVLHELSSKIGTSVSYEELFHCILTHLGKAVAYDVAASLLLTIENHRTLYLSRVRPLTAKAQSQVEERMRTACERLGGAGTFCRNLTVVPVADNDAGGPPITRLDSFFQVPILAGGAVIGLLFVGAERAEQLTEEHLRLLYTVANQASAAVQRMQAFLETERHRLRTVVDHLPEGVILLDRNQRITAANPAGRKLLECLSDVRPGEVLTALGDRSFTEAAEASPRDFVLDKPTRQVIEASIVRLQDEEAEPWLLILRDATDSREAIRRRDRFLAMLSHELRNPLAALTSAAHLLRLEGADRTIRERSLHILTRQLRHIARLVDDLLDASRFLHGKVQLHKEATDLAQLTARTVEAHDVLFTEEGKQLQADIAAGPLLVHGDPVRLTQVLDNLLSNARRFTPAGGLTQVRCHAEGEAIVLSVRDTGEGIEAGKFTEIFEPFMQVHDTLDRAQGGLGLGLALVKALTEMHGGSVAVHSDGPGRGSEFTVRWPRLMQTETAPPAEKPANDGQATAPAHRRVLIVEDESDVREMLQAFLELNGHEVYTAANGPEALTVFRRHEPEIALIDIGLPGMDGYELVRMLSQESHRSRARLIALSGYTRMEDRRRALEAGFDLHLAKPVRMPDLERVLAEAKTTPAPA